MTPEERRKAIEQAMNNALQDLANRAFRRAILPRTGEGGRPIHFNCRSVSVPIINANPFGEMQAELDRLAAEAAAGIPTKGRPEEPVSWDAFEEALGPEMVRQMRGDR